MLRTVRGVISFFPYKRSFYTSLPRLSRPLVRIPQNKMLDDEFFQAGNQHLIENQYQQAIKDYTSSKLVTEEMLNNIGVCYAHLHQYYKAEDAYASVLHINPQNFEAHYNLGCLYFLLDHTEKSFLYFRKAYELQPDNLAARKNYLSSLHTLIIKDVHETQYFSAHTKLDLMIHDILNKKYESTNIDLDEVKKLDKYLDYALTEKGKIYLEQRNYSQAVKVLRQATLYNPEYIDARDLYFKALTAMHHHNNKNSLFAFKDNKADTLISVNERYKPEL